MRGDGKGWGFFLGEGQGGNVESYGYRCAFQKTDLALCVGVVKESGAGSSQRPHIWRCGMVLEASLLSPCSQRLCLVCWFFFSHIIL